MSGRSMNCFLSDETQRIESAPLGFICTTLEDTE